MERRKAFPSSIMPLPAQEGLTKHGLAVQPALPQQQASETFTLHFALALPPEAQSKLEELVAAGKTVDPAALHADYAAAKEDAGKLADWLKSQGYNIEFVSADQTSLYARADATTIEKSLDVTMARVTIGGFTTLAARNAPQPAEIGGRKRHSHHRPTALPPCP